MTKKKIERLACDIREFLLKRMLWMDVTIYFNGKAFSTHDGDRNYAYNDPNRLFVLENEDPKKYFSYVGGVLSMSFEGPFYDVLNGYVMPAVHEEFVDLLDKHGCYYELGNSWNLSVFEK